MKPKIEEVTTPAITRLTVSKPVEVNKKNYRQQYAEPRVIPDKKVEIIRPKAEYTQSASPYGIANELHGIAIKG